MVVPDVHEVEAVIDEVKKANPDFGVRRVLATIKEQRSDWEISEKRVRKYLEKKCSVKDEIEGKDNAALAGTQSVTAAAKAVAAKSSKQPAVKVSPSLADAFKKYSEEGGSGGFSFGFGFGNQEAAAEDEQASARDRPRESRDDDDEWETDEEEWERREEGDRSGAGSSTAAKKKAAAKVKGKKKRSGIAAMYQAQLRGGGEEPPALASAAQDSGRGASPAAGGAMLPGNFVQESSPGCHVAYHDAAWILGVQPYHPSELGLGPGEEAPEISIDPEVGMLSVINVSPDKDKAFYISVGHQAYDGDDQDLGWGVARNQDGEESRWMTFVLVVRPSEIMDVCYLALPRGKGSKGRKGGRRKTPELKVESFVNEVDKVEPLPRGEPAVVFPFPLDGAGPFLCSQGVCGSLTHFYRETMHAIDLQCPVGTPVLAVGAGEVVSVQHSSQCGGIHVQNLFHWNSVLIRLDSGVLVEYVHIKAESVTRGVGERVSEGEVLCLSGDVGFCPSPHLHIQAHAAAEADHRKAPTIPFCLKGDQGSPFVPVAGGKYSKQGVCGHH